MPSASGPAGGSSLAKFFFARNKKNYSAKKVCTDIARILHGKKFFLPGIFFWPVEPKSAQLPPLLLHFIAQNDVLEAFRWILAQWSDRKAEPAQKVKYACFRGFARAGTVGNHCHTWITMPTNLHAPTPHATCFT